MSDTWADLRPPAAEDLGIEDAYRLIERRACLRHLPTYVVGVGLLYLPLVKQALRFSFGPERSWGIALVMTAIGVSFMSLAFVSGWIMPRYSPYGGLDAAGRAQVVEAIRRAAPPSDALARLLATEQARHIVAIHRTPRSRILGGSAFVVLTAGLTTHLWAAACIVTGAVLLGLPRHHGVTVGQAIRYLEEEAASAALGAPKVARHASAGAGTVPRNGNCRQRTPYVWARTKLRSS